MIRVCIKAKDYNYYGDVVGAAVKRSGTIRFVVEDEGGQLHIHSAEELGMPEATMRSGHICFTGRLTEDHCNVLRSLYERLGSGRVRSIP